MKPLEKIIDTEMLNFLNNINYSDDAEKSLLVDVWKTKENNKLKLQMLKLQLGVEEKTEKEWFTDPFTDE